MLLLFGAPLAMAVESFDSAMLLSVVKDTHEFRTHRLSTQQPKIPDSAYRKAATGVVATGLSEQVGWGVGVFQINIRELYATLNEEESHVSLSPVDYTKIIHGLPCSNHRQVMMHLPIPMVSDRWWVTTQNTNPHIRQNSGGQLAELTWNSLRDNTQFTLDETSHIYTTDAVWVTESSGAWLLIRLDDSHTLGEYHSWSDPGGYIPDGLAASLSASGIKETFNAMEVFAQNNIERCKYDWP